MPGHNFQFSDPVAFDTPQSGSLPSGVTAETQYWIAEIVDANTIKIATTRAGAAISLGTAGAGTQSIRTNLTGAAWPGWNWAPVTSTHIVTGWYYTLELDRESPDSAPSGHFFL